MIKAGQNRLQHSIHNLAISGPMLQKLENSQKREFGHLKFPEISLYYLITICSRIFIENMFWNNMKYFDHVTFTTNVMRKKVCVDILLFSVYSYRACAIASEVINIGHDVTIRFPNLELCYI